MGLISRVSSRTYRDMIGLKSGRFVRALGSSLNKRDYSMGETRALVNEVVAKNNRFKPGKPIHSKDLAEARRESRSLYRKFMRHIPYIMTQYIIAEQPKQSSIKLLELSLKRP